ncbi:MAG: hypothetical protein PHR65_09710 [Syntrophomonadaceae bacterium]|nr:hypothetical protein [Syntrophomonadaceae bacterium]
MAGMKKKYKVFIAVGIMVNVVLCLGLYVNHKLDNMVASLNRSGFISTEGLSQPSDLAPDPSVSLPGNSGSVGNSGGNGYTYTPETPETPEPSETPSAPNTQPSQLDITSGVQQKLGQPVEKKDLIEAGMIIMRRLNWDEITFLYNAGKKSEQTPEEVQQAREILRAKLTAEELATLKALGSKYGQSLRFLD